MRTPGHFGVQANFRMTWLKQKKAGCTHALPEFDALSNLLFPVTLLRLPEGTALIMAGRYVFSIGELEIIHPELVGGASGKIISAIAGRA